jgi:hypothetical protein
VLAGLAAPPSEVDWSALSPRSREILVQIGLRLSAGWRLEEVAAELDRTRPQLPHLPLPEHGVSKLWVGQSGVPSMAGRVRHRLSATEGGER